MNAAPLFNKIALIGFGLIGGSIARAARAQGLAGEIVTTARSAKTRARVAAERAVVTISPARPCARAARAIEPPISPKPISATRLKRGALFA